MFNGYPSPEGVPRVVVQQLIPLKRIYGALDPQPVEMALGNLTCCAQLGSFLACEDLEIGFPDACSAALKRFRTIFGGFTPKISRCNQTEVELQRDVAMLKLIRISDMRIYPADIAELKQLKNNIWEAVKMLLRSYTTYGKLEYVPMILEICGPEEINSRNADGETPVSQACHAGHLEVIRELVEKGVDVTILAHNGETCLQWIVSFDADQVLEMAELLIKHSANVKAHAKWDIPLIQRSLDLGCCAGALHHRAVSLKREVAVAALLNFGSDPLAHDGTDSLSSAPISTPLLMATTYHLTIILQLLLESSKCSAKYRVDETGKSLLWYAIASSRLPVFNYTKHQYRMILHGRAYRQAKRNTVSLLHHYGADLGDLYTDIYGNKVTALQVAVRENGFDMAQLLLELSSRGHSENSQHAAWGTLIYSTLLCLDQRG